MLLIIMSILPIFCLLICLLIIKMPAKKASAISFLLTTGIYVFYFKSGSGVFISMAKGFGLALFVILIIWGAMLLYNLEKESGALDVINRNIEIIIEDRMLQFLFLSWVFSAFLQGIAGFGVPVIVVTPILIGMGFSPVASVAAVLVGHSWSISFGSMGSSIYAISMVTAASPEGIVLYMAIFGTVAMVCTGVSVCFIYGEKGCVLRGIVYVLITSAAMGTTLYVMANMQMFSIIGLSTGAAGLITLFLVSRIGKYFGGGQAKKAVFYRNKVGMGQAMLPYMLIVLFSILFFFLDPKWSINLSFPGYETQAGVSVAAEEDYVKFNLLKFPFSIILMAVFISSVLFWKKGALKKDTVKSVVNATVQKCVPTTITIVFLLATAVLMMDSKMIENLAFATAELSEGLYPLFAPFIGLLGAFITGSNTNSNIIFGSFQEIAANTLGVSSVIMCAVQSIGASVGGGIGPTTVSLGAAAAQVQGQESAIYKKTLAPILITTLVLGIVNTILIY